MGPGHEKMLLFPSILNRSLNLIHASQSSLRPDDMFALSYPCRNRLHDTFNKEALKALVKHFNNACLMR